MPSGRRRGWSLLPTPDFTARTSPTLKPGRLKCQRLWTEEWTVLVHNWWRTSTSPGKSGLWEQRWSSKMRSEEQEEIYLLPNVSTPGKRGSDESSSHCYPWTCIVTFPTTCQDARIQDSSPLLHLGDSVVHESQFFLHAAWVNLQIVIVLCSKYKRCFLAGSRVISFW